MKIKYEELVELSDEFLGIICKMAAEDPLKRPVFETTEGMEL